MFNYPVKLEHDEATGTYVVTCRDLPLLNSVGESVDEALLEAVDAVTVAIAIEMDERRPVPIGSLPEEGEYVVNAPALVALKAALHNAMIETGTRKADLARMLDIKAPNVERLLDMGHATKLQTLERALQLLGREIFIDIRKSS